MDLTEPSKLHVGDGFIYDGGRELFALNSEHVTGVGMTTVLIVVDSPRMRNLESDLPCRPKSARGNPPGPEKSSPSLISSGNFRSREATRIT